MEIAALDRNDHRISEAKAAGAAALLVAKLHKIGERVNTPNRLIDKDAHDAYRILRATETNHLGGSFARLLADTFSADATRESLVYLGDLFAAGPDALGALMAGRAEEGVGDPAQVSAAVSFLASDLMEALEEQ